MVFLLNNEKITNKIFLWIIMLSFVVSGLFAFKIIDSVQRTLLGIEVIVFGRDFGTKVLMWFVTWLFFVLIYLTIGIIQKKVNVNDIFNHVVDNFLYILIGICILCIGVLVFCVSSYFYATAKGIHTHHFLNTTFIAWEQVEEVKLSIFKPAKGNVNRLIYFIKPIRGKGIDINEGMSYGRLTEIDSLLSNSNVKFNVGKFEDSYVNDLKDIDRQVLERHFK